MRKRCLGVGKAPARGLVFLFVVVVSYTGCRFNDDCTITAPPEDGLDGRPAQSTCPAGSHCFIDEASVWREQVGQKGVCVEGPAGGIPRVAHWGVHQPFPQPEGTAPPPSRPYHAEVSPIEAFKEGGTSQWTAAEKAQYERLYLRHLGRIHTVPAAWPAWEKHREDWQVRALVEGVPADGAHLLEAWYALPGEGAWAAKAKLRQQAECREVGRPGRHRFEVVCQFKTLPQVDGLMQVYVQPGLSRSVQDGKPLRLGAQTRLYSVAVQPPVVKQLVASPAHVLAGDTLTVCVEAAATAGVRSAALQDIAHSIAGAEAFEWRPVPLPNGSAHQQCQQTTVPLNISFPPNNGQTARRGTGEFTLSTRLKVEDSLCEDAHAPCAEDSSLEEECQNNKKALAVAAALCNETYSNVLQTPTPLNPAPGNYNNNAFQPSSNFFLQRLTCKTEAITQSGSPVSHPPAWVTDGGNGKPYINTLVFGTASLSALPEHNSLFFVDTTACESITSDAIRKGNPKDIFPASSIPSLHSGPLLGPPVSLPSTGKIGVALGKGARNLGTSVLSVVSTQDKKFVYPNSVSRDCIGPPASTASFDKGLALLSWPGKSGNPLQEWAFVSVKNAGAFTKLIAYFPDMPPGASNDHCKASSLALPGALSLGGVGDREGRWAVSYMMGGRSHIALWAFEDNAWEAVREGNEPVSLLAGNRALTHLAVGDGFLWYTDPSEGSQRGLWRWDMRSQGSEQIRSRVDSPVAIDDRGHAYFVEDRHLRRHPANGSGSSTDSFPVGHNPVGSPILGERAVGGAEIFVVTTGGGATTVSVFNDNLELLWQEAFDFSTSAGAQPLLVGNTLWLVGAQGQVHGLRVNADGLHKKAPWPKHLRDNCNSANAQAKLEGCL